VVRTFSSLFVFDPNGFPVAKVPHSSEFAVYTTFHTRDGSDFVAFQDSSLKTFYFEAAYPSQMFPLESSGVPLVCIDYDCQHDRFFFVGDHGKVLVASRSII
jgi:hypothetical protein